MGSHTSKENSSFQSNNLKNSIISNNSETRGLGITTSSIGTIFNENSSYNGIVPGKMKINNIITKSEHYNSDQVTQEKTESEVQNKNLIKFYWREGGNEVFITGSFCDWSKRFKMHKNKNDIFEVELFLTKGLYQFKFIVNNIWRCSSDYPQTKDDQGIYNNFIDSSNINMINNNFNKSLNKENIISNLTKEKNQIVKRESIDELKNNYSNKYPYREQLNPEAPKTPDVFEISLDFNENSNQKYLGNKEFFEFSIINSDDSFKNILQIFHPYLNHLFTNNDLKYKKDDGNNIRNRIKFIGINCNVKVKNKYLSIVYYSPVNKK
jgi:5'-AMP-activated protein kinase regulatory beta subunit